MEMVAETTKTIVIVMGMAKEKKNSKESATTVGKLVAKKPIAGRITPTRNQPSSIILETPLDQISRS